ncbi:MAG TPA: alpha/beta fold hydrolase [Gemmatimonadaceae bacterium]
MSRSGISAAIRHRTSTARGDQLTLDLVHRGERVPAVWLTPSAPRSPTVLLLHGFSSSKERMASSMGRALQELGVASLALDLPFHGERDGDRGVESLKNPLVLVGAWKAAIAEARAAVTWLSEQGETDADRMGVVGYSLGGFLALMAAAEDERLRVVALAAAGDLPDRTPYASLVRGLVNPLRAAKRLDGRPLLLVNGRHDTTTRPEQAERLFEAATEPKTMQWYAGGHWPPQSAIARAAQWTADRLKEIATGRGRSRRTG